MSSDSNSVLSGVDGLDTLLVGGFPSNRTILVIGGPGSGKSILGAQFLKDSSAGKGVYVSLDYSKKSFNQDMKQFGWDFEQMEKEGSFLFLDGSAIRRIPQTQDIEGMLSSTNELTLEDVVDLIKLYKDKIGATKVVIDDLTSLVFRFPDEMKRRNAILSFIESLNEMNVTSLIISEASMYELGRQINTEEFLADGVVRMFMLQDGTRAIQISKMRGVPVDNKPHPYSIVSDLGIEVFPTETVFSQN